MTVIATPDRRTLPRLPYQTKQLRTNLTQDFVAAQESQDSTPVLLGWRVQRFHSFQAADSGFRIDLPEPGLQRRQSRGKRFIFAARAARHLPDRLELLARHEV